MKGLEFIEFRSKTLQGLTLVKDFPPNHWSKDDLENWVKKEWERHQKKKEEKKCQ